MPPSVAKGGTLHTTWAFYRPPASGTPTEARDPDEFPEGPRFAVYPAAGDTPVPGFEALPYARRYAPGVFTFNLPIPFADGVLDAADYEIRPELASVGGLPLVGRSGAIPSAPFTVIAGASAFPGDRPYVTPAELGARFGIGDVEPHEVGFAQQILDDWMHRSLWPTVIEKERQTIPEDRNQLQLDVTPVIRLFGLQATEPITAASMVGRYGQSRRNRRNASPFGSFFQSTLAALGGPATFFPIDPAAADCHLETGQLWLPAGPYLTSYSQVEVTYEAGLRVIPEAAKWAVAETIALVRMKGLGPISQWSIGRVSLGSGETLVTDEVRRRLGRYQVQYLR